MNVDVSIFPSWRRAVSASLFACSLFFAHGYSQTAADHVRTARKHLQEAEKLAWLSDARKTRLAQALDALSSAIQLDQGSAAYYAERAKVNELLDDLDAGLKDASNAIRLAPDEPEYYVVRASIRYSIEAIRVADAREKLDDSEEAARKLNADHSDAVKDYSRAISLAPKVPRWYVERGTFFDMTKNYGAALDDFSRAVALDPQNTTALRSRGILRSQQGLYTGAIEDFTSLIRIDPRNTAAYLARAEAYEALKQYDEAIADSTAAHKSAPNSPGPLQVRAERYRKIGKVALARKDELAAKRLLSLRKR